ncbi:MAG: T9SS type A sorting domain-containing protein [Bacteroidota bacterium]
MKKLLFLTGICLIAYTMSLKAQITIDSTDFASIGDTVILAHDSIPPGSITVGGTGAQSWDFTSLQIDYVDSLMFVDPSTTPNSSMFPGSNLAMLSSFRTVYLQFNSSELIIDGFFGDPSGGMLGLSLGALYDPNQKVIDFPSTYNDSFDDTSKFDLSLDAALLDPSLPGYGVDSIRFNHYSYVNSQIDAFGTVELPSGTFNTIRQFYTENTIDSIWAYCSNPIGCFIIPFGWSLAPVMDPLTANPILDTTYTYKWIANGEKYPVVELETDNPAGNVISANFNIGNSVVAMIASSSDALCNGNCDGEATATGISGVLPFTYLWDDTNNQATATATGLCAGTYTVRIIDATPDTSAATVTIGEPSPLSGTITIMDTISCDTCSDGSAIASATVGTGTPNYTFTWDDPDSQIGPYATGLAPGTYTVTITDANGCTFDASVTFIGVSSIYELFGENIGIHVYPNPAANELNVITSMQKEGVVRIYNIFGKQIKRVVLKGSTTKVNTSKLADGMYIYQVIDEEGNILKNGKFNVIK